MKENLPLNNDATAMVGTDANVGPGRDESSADRGYEDESMEVEETAPVRPPNLPHAQSLGDVSQASASSEMASEPPQR